MEVLGPTYFWVEGARWSSERFTDLVVGLSCRRKLPLKHFLDHLRRIEASCSQYACDITA